MTSTHDDQSTLWSLIKDIKFAMFTHRHEDGMLHSAPLTTQNGKDDQGSVLYFFVSRAGDIAHCVMRDGNVNVSYADPGADSYVSISGAASIVENRARNCGISHSRASTRSLLLHSRASSYNAFRSKAEQKLFHWVSVTTARNICSPSFTLKTS